MAQRGGRIGVAQNVVPGRAPLQLPLMVAGMKKGLRLSSAPTRSSASTGEDWRNYKSLFINDDVSKTMEILQNLYGSYTRSSKEDTCSLFMRRADASSVWRSPNVLVCRGGGGGVIYVGGLCSETKERERDSPEQQAHQAGTANPPPCIHACMLSPSRMPCVYTLPHSLALSYVVDTSRRLCVASLSQTGHRGVPAVHPA